MSLTAILPQKEKICKQNTSLNEKKVKVHQKRSQQVWTDDQNKIYVEFLKSHRQILNTKRIRRQKRVFVILAKYISTRTVSQCRSHHQRMLITHKSLKGIIKYMQYLQHKIQQKLGNQFCKSPTIDFGFQSLQSQSQRCIKNQFILKQENKQIPQQSPQEKQLWCVLNCEFFIQKRN